MDETIRARLVVVSGPSRGAELLLEPGEVVIGRDTACRLSLPDATLSRRHAAVVRCDSGYVLRDLGSLNGVRVNGAPASEQRLVSGDRVELGGSALLFLEGERPEEPPDPTPAGGLTLRLPARDAVFVAGASLPVEGRAARDLAALLAATRRLGEARTEKALADLLLSIALESVPAAAGALLLGTDADALEVVASAWRDGSEAPVPVSRSTASRAFAAREAQIWMRAAPPPDAGIGDTESLRSSGASSVLVVPLLARDDAAGVLSLLSRTPGDGFGHEDAQLLLGLCSSAALSLAVVRHVTWLEGERRRLASAGASTDEMVGSSPAMARLRERLARVAAADTTVLLLGESGTGKELAARAIHGRSARRQGPFVAVNAAALVESLAESELFGHERGAFTGAVARRLGLLEAARGGTLFLDEVGEMSLAVQAKLLRALETRQIERVGGSAPVPVDFRLVAATNRPLAAEVKAGRFREDLYYRLCVLTLDLPPLRERPEDLPALASFFLARHAERLGKRFDGFAPAALALLRGYAWPGNIRELSNAVERAVVLSDGGLVRPDDLPEGILESAASGAPAEGSELAPYHEAVNRAKREAVAAAMASSRGNVTEAAHRLGLHPNYLHRLLNHLGLRDP